MSNQVKKNKEYLEKYGLVILQTVIPKETKRAYKSITSLEGVSMNDVTKKLIMRYVASKSKS